MSSLTTVYYTPEQYLALEREAEYKSEYINGQIYAMSGASREHNQTAGNMFREISTQLRGRPCEAYVSDMRVKVNPTGMYTYPDVVAVCGEANFEDGQVDTLTNPAVIIEVLSPSTEMTEMYDRSGKFAHYLRLESLTDYVLISQDEARVEHYTRYSGNGKEEQWMLTLLTSMEGVLRLTSIGCEVALTDIYEKVSLPEVEERKPGLLA